MPILDMDPGTSPEAPGTLQFYKQGSSPSTGFQVTSEGDVTTAGTITATGGLTGDIVGFIENPTQGFTTLATDSATKAAAGTALNAAIAALPTNGGTIMVPQGTWTIDTAVLINKNGVKIQGVGNGVSLFRFDGSTITAAFKMADTTQRYFQMDNVRIESTADGQGTAIDASYFVNSVFSNIRIGASSVNPNKGIIFNALGSYYNVVRDCRISVLGVGSQAIAFDTTSNSNVVHNCRLVGTADTTGVYVNSHAIEINRVDCESSMNYAIDIGASGHDCTIISPYIEGVSTGVRINVATEACTILGGVIIDCTTANITDGGSKGFNVYNTRLQYDPYTRQSIWNPAFSVSFPAPSNTNQPQDHSVHTWTIDPTSASSSTLLTNGTLYLARVRLHNNIVGATKLWYQVATVATTPTAGQNWIGLYNSSGTKLVEVSTDALLGSTGPISATIASTDLAPGYYWIGFLCNAATAVTLARAGGLSASGNSFNQTNSTLRFAVNGTGLTTLPASITTSSNSVTGSIGFFGAIS